MDAPDIQGGDTVEQARRGAADVAVRGAVAELAEVVSGTAGRSLAEIREHVAFLERLLPLGAQARVRGNFGGLLDPDLPEARE